METKKDLSLSWHGLSVLNSDHLETSEVVQFYLGFLAANPSTMYLVNLFLMSSSTMI